MKKLMFRATLALLAGLSTQHVLYAAQDCSNADLKGVYGMFATGTIVLAPPPVPTVRAPGSRTR